MSIADDLQRIRLQEETLQFPSFGPDTAWQLGLLLRETSRERNLPVVIDVRRFELPLFYAALPGTTPDNPDWVRRKSNTVARFLRSSYAIGLELKEKNADLAEKYALPARDYASHGGSFPLAVTGAGVIGSVTVSGLPQRDDHELVVEALCAILDRPYEEFRLSV